MSLKVVFAGGFEGTDFERLKAALPELELVVVANGEAERLPAELEDAHAFVGNSLGPADTRSAKVLRLVQAYSAGADGIDPAALPNGCAFCNLYGHERAIAEWALMCMLVLSRGLLTYDRGLRKGNWRRYGDETLELECLLGGSTVGLIGFGHIGRETAALAGAVGMDAVAVTRTPTPERGAGLRWLGGLESLHQLLAEADFAVVTVPLSDETSGLINEAELRALGPRGYLLNPARGEIIDEEALFVALRDGRIAGAAIDTWYRYPAEAGEVLAPSRFPFGELDNVVMTPHVSGRSQTTRELRWAWLEAQLRRFARGEPLENVVAVG